MGIQRVARGLLRQVVGRYLSWETACVHVLHSITTLAIEMVHAMQEGEWTANAPINGLLDVARPVVDGAKLTGAGGFLILVSRSERAAVELE
jgi:hypothetical protein